MPFPLASRALYTFNGDSMVILLQEHRSLQMSCWLPHVVTFRVAKPLDQVLQLFSPPLTLVAADGLDFILFCVPHKVGWWPGVVFPMFFCFTIRGKKRGVKHGVDGPLMGECKFVCHWGYHLSDGKGAVPPWG